MPKLQLAVTYLNRAFDEQNIDDLVDNRNAFAPGKQISSALKFVLPQELPIFKDLIAYVESLPGSLQESIRSIVYHALSTSPPTRATFAWAPGYDFQMTVWQAPDTRQTPGGITVLLKSRYPDDPHPVSGRTSTRRGRS